MQKKAGILVHITSLPGQDKTGTLDDALSFLEILSEAGQSIWQFLPITSTERIPFAAYSLSMGNPMLIGLETLVDDGDLDMKHYKSYTNKCVSNLNERVDFEFIKQNKIGPEGILRKAYAGFKHNNDQKRNVKFNEFCSVHEKLLDPFALFMTIREIYKNKPWYTWPDQQKFLMNGYDKELPKDTMEFYRYVSFVFHEQMTKLHEKAQGKKIELIGDLPFYPSYDSVEVWKHKHLFQLDEKGQRQSFAGVPPDAFQGEGQLWKENVLYRWGSVGTDKEYKQIYDLLSNTIRVLLQYHNILKLDHLRGYVAYGSIPDNSNPKEAKWVRGPGKEYFEHLKHSLNQQLPFIVEDLGVITDDVRAFQQELGFPGMNVFLFAEPCNNHHMYLPHNAEPNSVSYTGTHDNETLIQALYEVMDEEKRNDFLKYLSQSEEIPVNWKAIDLLYKSKSERVIIPIQDVLGLGAEARMNIPGTTSGNWGWRMTDEQFRKFSDYSISHLKEISQRNSRSQ